MKHTVYSTLILIVFIAGYCKAADTTLNVPEHIQLESSVSTSHSTDTPSTTPCCSDQTVTSLACIGVTTTLGAVAGMLTTVICTEAKIPQLKPFPTQTEWLAHVDTKMNIMNSLAPIIIPIFAGTCFLTSLGILYIKRFSNSRPTNS